MNFGNDGPMKSNT